MVRRVGSACSAIAEGQLPGFMDDFNAGSAAPSPIDNTVGEFTPCPGRASWLELPAECATSVNKMTGDLMEG